MYFQAPWTVWGLALGASLLQTHALPTENILSHDVSSELVVFITRNKNDQSRVSVAKSETMRTGWRKKPVHIGVLDVFGNPVEWKESLSPSR